MRSRRRLGVIDWGLLPGRRKSSVVQRNGVGLGVQLRDWRYPVVFDLTTGESKFDNYGGAWGKQERLNEFLQAYAVEKTQARSNPQGLLRHGAAR